MSNITITFIVIVKIEFNVKLTYLLVAHVNHKRAHTFIFLIFT